MCWLMVTRRDRTLSDTRGLWCLLGLTPLWLHCRGLDLQLAG